MSERWKLWSAILGIAGVILVAIIWYYNIIQSPLWEAQQAAKSIALEQTALADVTEVQTFAGADSYQIVFGTDEEGEQWIVWVGKDVIHAERADQGWANNQIRLLMQDKEPDAEVIRIVPGVWQEEYVWEVYYQKHEEKGRRNYYDYYRFKDGKKLTTLRLSLIPE